MEDAELQKRLQDQDEKLVAILRSIDRMRRFAMVRMIITIVVVLLPIIGLWIAIPQFLKAFDLSRYGL